MKMTELLRYDVPPEIIHLWQTRESERLLPLQEQAVRRYDLFGKSNLLIQAPTSSGKTFIGEMAAVQTALRRKKVVYLVPLKALAEEKWADFREKYTPYGMRVIISTRDRREFDQDFERGAFSIAVVVYEKLAQLLVRRPERVAEIELIIADELEILSDPERGPSIEVLLTRLLEGGASCLDLPRNGGSRVIGLSAVIGQADRLAEWMKAGLLSYDRRPVELRYGVLHEGVFRYRTYNEYSEGEERLESCFSDSPWEILTETLAGFVERDEPCLVFVKDKYASRRGAEVLARRLTLPPASRAIEALRDLRPTHCRERLMELMAHGVAFHNADLSPEERRVVEEAFRSEEIKAVVSTSTLAVGMNLPAQNVFISTDKWQYDDRFGMPWKAPILRSEYENMGGRAGRYGSGKAFGRSILIAPTPFDLETLWRRYVDGEREQIVPTLGQRTLEDHVMRLVASGTCRTDEELHRFLECTPTGRWVWAESLTVDESRFHVRAAVHRAIDAGMLASKESGRLEATPFGWAVASKGITLATALDLAAWIRESEMRVWGEADLLFAAASTRDGRMPQVALTMNEYEHADYPGLLKRRVQDEELSADVPLNRIRNSSLTPFFEEVRAIKMVLVLLDWIEEVPVYDLEEHHRVLAGQILSAAQQVSWLIDAAAAIAEAFGARQAFLVQLSAMADRVARGLRESALPLARQPIVALDRSILGALAAQGIDSIQAVQEAPQNLLSQWMPAREAELLKQWAAEQTPDESAPPEPLLSIPRPILVVDDRRPDQIQVDGAAVGLQEKQFRLIRMLAESPGECVAYDSIYDVLWGEAVVEPNQMHFQKRRLIERIGRAAPGRETLVRTIPKRGFMLDLLPSQVMLISCPVGSAA